MRRRRLTPTSQITIAAVLLWLLAIAGISQANAAQLTVNTMSPGAIFSISGCADGLTAIPEDRKGNSQNYGEVQISTIPSSCNGLPLAYFLLDDAGDVLISGAGTATTGVMTFTASGNYKADDVDDALVFIGTWPIPTTWSMAAPPAASCVGIDPATPGQTYSCTFTIDETSTWTTSGYRYTNLRFDAVTTAPLWQVTIDLSSTSAGFTGMSPVRFVGSYQNVEAAPGYACSSLPTFVGREANPSWGSSNAEITFSDDPGYSGGTAICDI